MKTNPMVLLEWRRELALTMEPTTLHIIAELNSLLSPYCSIQKLLPQSLVTVTSCVKYLNTGLQLWHIVYDVVNSFWEPSRTQILQSRNRSKIGDLGSFVDCKVCQLDLTGSHHAMCCFVVVGHRRGDIDAVDHTRHCEGRFLE